MAYRLPKYRPNSVQTARFPGVRVGVNVPNAFGENIGRGLESLGQDIAQVQIREMRIADNTKVEEAMTALSAYDSNALYGKDGMTRLGGKAAMDRAQPLEQERAAHLASVRAGLNQRQRAEFDFRTRTHNAAFQQTLATKFAQASDAYADETHKSGALSFVDGLSQSAPSQVSLVTSPAGTPLLNTELTDLSIGQRLDAIDRYYAANGQRMADPEGARKAEIRDTLNAGHSAVISSLVAQGRDQDAAAYFEVKKGELSPKVRDSIQADVTRATQDATVQRGVGAAWSQFVPPSAFEPPKAGIERPSESQMKADAHAWISKNITDQSAERDLASETIKQFDANFKAQSDKAETDRKAWAAELDAEVAGGATWEAITTDPRYARLSTDQQESRATAFKARMDGTYAVTSPALYDEVTSEMVAAVQSGDLKFMERDFREMAAQQEISEADAREWSGVQDKIIKAKQSGEASGYAGFLSIDEQVNAAAVELYGNDQDEAEDRGAFKRKANEILRAKYAGPDEKPDYEGAKKELDGMVAEQVYRRSTIPNFPDILAPDFMFEERLRIADLPEAELSALVTAMRRNGVPVTAANIAEAVRRRRALETARE